MAITRDIVIVGSSESVKAIKVQIIERFLYHNGDVIVILVVEIIKCVSSNAIHRL
jgi:hypothetical protein